MGHRFVPACVSTNSIVVIPGCATWRRPGIHNHDREYGFRARSFHSRPGMTGKMTSRTATLIGLTAILMWSLLAALTVATGKIPAFQLAAMTFAIGALVGFLTFIVRPEAVRAVRQRPTGGIGGGGGAVGL